jgi:hypothetical protein
LRERLPAGPIDYDPLDLDGPRRGDGHWRGSFAAAGFEPLQDTRMANPRTLDREGLVRFFASMGWIAEIPDEERPPLLAEVRSLVTTSEYRRLWATHVYWTHLLRH